MADREFVFGNPEIQSLIREKFIPLAMDDWYMRRQKDADGEFFRAMTEDERCPRKDAGENTRQGRYAFSASGKFLSFNNNRSPERILAMLKEGLKHWDALPEADRKTTLSNAPKDERYARTPPKNGAVIKVHTRVLDFKDGKFQHCVAPEDSSEFKHRGFGAAIDHLWLSEEEIKALAHPTSPSLSEAVIRRIARYHLADNTRGEPPFWGRDEIKKAAITLTPGKNGEISLVGEFHLETSDTYRGYQAKMLGQLKVASGKLTEFSAIVLGDHWGEGHYTKGARPGKTPMGVSFQLVPNPAAADRIPPQGARWLQGYVEADRH